MYFTGFADGQKVLKQIKAQRNLVGNILKRKHRRSEYCNLPEDKFNTVCMKRRKAA